MWICLNNSFLSAVSDRNDPEGLVVRARKRGHLVDAFKGHDINIIKSPVGSDYAYRIRIKRKALAAIMAEKITNIDYDNFKNSVKDVKLHDMYLKWWFDHVKVFKKVEDR